MKKRFFLLLVAVIAPGGFQFNFFFAMSRCLPVPAYFVHDERVPRHALRAALALDRVCFVRGLDAYARAYMVNMLCALVITHDVDIPLAIDHCLLFQRKTWWVPCFKDWLTERELDFEVCWVWHAAWPHFGSQTKRQHVDDLVMELEDIGHKREQLKEERTMLQRERWLLLDRIE